MKIVVFGATGSTGLAADPDGLDWSPNSEGEMFDLTTERLEAFSELSGSVSHAPAHRPLRCWLA